MTFPLYVYGVALRGIPIQVNVLATMLFMVTVVAILLVIWQQRRAERMAAMRRRRGGPPPARRAEPEPDRGEQPAETRLLIGGEQVEGAGEPLEVENPATEETLPTVGSASPEQVAAAIAAAREAARGWERTPAIERGELLHEVASRLRDDQEELAAAMTAEGGKPLIENRDEVEWSAAAFDYYAEIGRDSAGRVIPPIEATQLSIVVKEPFGVVGCIVPWNYPLLLLAWKLAPALAAGNTTVCKPSELTPISTLMLAGCFDHLPAGAVNLIAGAGEVGAALTADPGIDCVAFTGSVETGKRVALACAERVARVNLEMGGKDPFIVCADVGAEGVEVAARGGAWAAYLNAGQVCTSAERFYVAADVYDDYVSAFVEHTDSLVVGDPTAPRHRRRPDGLRARSATRSRTRSRPRSPPGRSSSPAGATAATSAATTTPRR